MDLHDFDVDDLYFENAPSEEVSGLLQRAAGAYASGRAEPFLKAAHTLAPDNLMVLVAEYRFYYYQHRYPEAIEIAEQAIFQSGKLFGFRGHWRQMTLDTLSYGMMQSFGMVRFYLLALKGAGYLHLRLNKVDEGIEMLEKVKELDSADRLGAQYLLDIAYRQKGIYSLNQYIAG